MNPLHAKKVTTSLVNPSGFPTGMRTGIFFSSYSLFPRGTNPFRKLRDGTPRNPQEFYDAGMTLLHNLSFFLIAGVLLSFVVWLDFLPMVHYPGGWGFLLSKMLVLSFPRADSFPAMKVM